jgi:CHAT domain-containing protein
MTQSNPSKNLRSSFRLTGAKEPKIEILKGAQWGEERTRRMFERASWLFHPDGRFLFIPSQNTDVRLDLFPISGNYSKVDDRFEFQGERQSPSGTSASVDGIIDINGENILLNVIYTVAAMASQKIAKISQTLFRQPQAASSELKIIDGTRVPSIFRISLKGKTEAHPFGPLPGILKILPRYPGDPNPFFVTFSTDTMDTNGSILWDSFTHLRFGQGKPNGEIIVRGNQVRLEVKTSENIRVGLTWFTQTRGELVPDIPVGVTVKSGTFTFSIKGKRISGEIHASGISDFNQSSAYEAQFIGQRQESNLDFTTETTLEGIRTAEVSSSFNGGWATDAFGQVELQQKGQRVSGTYTGRGGGTIEGIVQGNRLDFTWKNSEKGKGSGFFRAISGGETLAGLWGYGTDETKVEPLIATLLKQSSLLFAQTFTSPDKQRLRDLGYKLVLQGKCVQALELLEKTLELYKEERRKEGTWYIVKDTYLIDEVNILSRLSYCYFQIEDYDKLLEHLMDAIKTRHLLSQKEYLKGISKEQADLVQAALSNYLELWRARLVTDIDKITALEKGQPFFQKLVEFLVELGSEKEALVVSEKARGRAFVDLLAGRSDIQRSLEQSFPKETEIPSPTTVSPLTLKDVLEIIQQRQSVTIEYFLMDEHLIIWVISPSGNIDTITAHINKKELEKSITEKFLPLVQSQNPSIKDLSNVLQDLYKQLIDPIPSRLLPTSPGDVITIIPHGALFRIPFGALKDGAGKYFIEKHALVHSASIAVLKYTRENKSHIIRSKNPNLLAFVNPKPFPDPKLSSLEVTEQSFDLISQFYPDTQHNKILKGERATKKALQKEAPQYTVLHFATHAEASENELLESFIALAQVSPEDGYLRVPDVFRLNLYADLVILAACKTGAGEITGDGVNGLSRAFCWAGTPTLLISLWNVPETQSLQQMYEFHKYWRKNGKSKAQALRKAQLKCMNYGYNRDRPDLWAGFVIFGEGD